MVDVELFCTDVLVVALTGGAGAGVALVEVTVADVLWLVVVEDSWAWVAVASATVKRSADRKAVCFFIVGLGLDTDRSGDAILMPRD